MQATQFFVLKNTTNTNNLPLLKDLIKLKCLYSKQLSKMPRQYLVKLLFDTYHESLIIKINQEIVAGITFRGFDHKQFYEIAFVAVNYQNQCQGLGSKVMNRFKNLCQERGISRIFTFADNGAIGFFEKHGFSKNITLPPKQYKACIKQYIGGEMMECKIDLEDKIDFESLDNLLEKSKNQIIQKVKSLTCQAPYSLETASKIVSSLKNQEMLLEEMAEYIPGVKESGYDKDKFSNEDKRLTLNFLLYCQHFIQLAASKASILIDDLEQCLDKGIITQSQYRKNMKKSEQFEGLIFNLQINLLNGYFKYKDQLIEEFTKRLEKIFGPEESLRGKEKLFMTKINQLNYEFMKNLLSYQVKDRKLKQKKN